MNMGRFQWSRESGIERLSLYRVLLRGICVGSVALALLFCAASQVGCSAKRQVTFGHAGAAYAVSLDKLLSRSEQIGGVNHLKGSLLPFQSWALLA